MTQSQPDRSNWRTPPFNRWAFHNIDAILPVAEIAAPPATPALARAPVDLDAFSLDKPGGGALDLSAFMAATATDAMVVLHEGKLVFEAYDNGMAADTRHILMSASKAMTGLVAGIAASRGLVDLDAPASAYVPEIAATGYAGATLRQLIDMRAGVTIDDATRADYDAAIAGDPTAPTLHDFLQGLTGPAQAHGGPFSYISANTDLAGWAIERATGRSIAALIQDLLWTPLGAEQDAQIIVDREGSPWCSGGFCMTARDLARVGALLVDGGSRDGIEIVAPALIDDLCGGGDREAWRTGEWGDTFAFVSRQMSYRAGWYAVHGPHPMLFAMGIHGQNLFVDRANRLVIAKLSSQAAPIDPMATWMTHAAAPLLRELVMAEAR